MRGLFPLGVGPDEEHPGHANDKYDYKKLGVKGRRLLTDHELANEDLIVDEGLARDLPPAQKHVNDRVNDGGRFVFDAQVIREPLGDDKKVHVAEQGEQTYDLGDKFV